MPYMRGCPPKPLIRATGFQGAVYLHHQLPNQLPEIPTLELVRQLRILHAHRTHERGMRLCCPESVALAQWMPKSLEVGIRCHYGSTAAQILPVRSTMLNRIFSCAIENVCELAGEFWIDRFASCE